MGREGCTVGAQHGVVAALRVERDAYAGELGAQPHRPRARADHQGRDRQRAAVGVQAGGAALAQREVQHLAPQDGAARRDEVGRERLDQPFRVAGEAVVRQQQARLDIAGQRRLQVVHLARVQCLRAHPGGIADGLRQHLAGRARQRAPDIQVAGGADQVVVLGRLQQAAVARIGGAEEVGQRSRHGARLRFGASADPLEKPGQCARQVGPAHRQRPLRVRQPFRHLRQHARQRHRHHRCHAEAAGITVRAPLADARLVQQGDPMAVALQLQRARHADDAGAHYRDGSPPGRVCCVVVHGKAGRASSVDRTSSAAPARA